ncbi:putative collagen triple helix repeat-containing domain protein, partial [Trichinella spiralis]|uniref:putative collagen triple helix repeat-containing domain protein n=1 Tax=Trichinella spiralis TaxID=6334 RepID=UPI0001EFDC4B
MTDGSWVRIIHEPATATRPGIGCAWNTASPREVPLEETVGEGPETDSGELEACERALMDRAECSAQNRRALRNLLRRYGKVISCGEGDLGRTNRRGLAGEASTPSPSSSPAGDSGPLDQGNAARRGNRISLRPLELTGSAGPKEGRLPAVLRRLSQAECRDARRRPTHPAHRRYAGCAGGGQVVQHPRLGVRLLAELNLRKRTIKDS